MVGRTISHYKVLSKLGQGAMVEVWKGQDLDLKRSVALKFLSSETVGTLAPIGLRHLDSYLINGYGYLHDDELEVLRQVGV